MSVLTSAPYLLSEGNIVVATIETLNEIGYSDPSDENLTGAVIQTVPHPPTLKPTRGANTSDT
jgi:hypothetical protein